MKEPPAGKTMTTQLAVMTTVIKLAKPPGELSPGHCPRRSSESMKNSPVRI
jgi:hypothetical protein